MSRKGYKMPILFVTIIASDDTACNRFCNNFVNNIMF